MTKPPPMDRRCSRCRRAKSPRGGMSATVAGEDDVPRRKFVCASCIAELAGAWLALYFHAENAEREEARQIRRAA